MYGVYVLCMDCWGVTVLEERGVVLCHVVLCCTVLCCTVLEKEEEEEVDCGLWVVVVVVLYCVVCCVG